MVTGDVTVARDKDDRAPQLPSASAAAAEDEPSTLLLNSEGFQQELDAVGAGLTTTEETLQLEAARKLRQLLSSNRERFIQEALDRDWVPLLLGWLQLHQRPAVQVEALWALTNIAAAGTVEHSSHVLIKHGAAPALVALLSSNNEEVLEQATWVLGNLAGEGVAARDAALAAGAVRPLLQCIGKQEASLSMIRIGSWTLSNLCDGQQPRPALDIHVILPTLTALLQSDDAEVLSHACWALSHLCDGPSAHIAAAVDADICWRLVQLLTHGSWRVVKPALRTVGNIVCAEDEADYTQHVIEAEAVPCLRQLIAHTNREIQKEACWTLSNIAAGTIPQIQTVLDSGAMPSLMDLASTADCDLAEVKNEACWVVLNAASCGSDSQIVRLVDHGCVAVLGDLLSETSMVMMALEGLERVLQVGDEEAKRGLGTNPYASLLLLSSARIEELEAHRSSAISKRASRIWKEHFVTCAICGHSFSKRSPQAHFCGECKCHVCHECNCAVFHLSYQEALWSEMTEKESSVKAAQLEKKRLKKQKKKKKKNISATGQTAKAKHSPGDEDDDDLAAGDGDADGEEDADDESPQESPVVEALALPATPPEQWPVPAPPSVPHHLPNRRGRLRVGNAGDGPAAIFDTKLPAGGVDRARRRRAADSASISSSAGSHKVSRSGVGDPSANEQLAPGIGRSGPELPSAASTAQAVLTDKSPVCDREQGPTKLRSIGSDAALENDKLVSFLQQTGSILALADLLDEESPEMEADIVAFSPNMN